MQDYLRKFITTSSVVALFALISIPAFISGHSPSTMSLSYDLQTNLLEVNISHSVSNTDNHYIESVEIWLNDVLNRSENYDSQPTTNSFSYEYTILANIGDEIEVIATCNQFGSMTRTLTVTNTTDTSSTPTNNAISISITSALSVILLFSGLMIVNRRKRNQS
ncbi:MAG: hypothetical protein U9O98_00575 [Asgard group archaeon]|nr:hypothetical protein [Asgard group archaeon]